MAFTPISAVYLIDAPLDNTYKNQIYFSDTVSQYNYFVARKKHTFERVTYVKESKETSIRVDKHINQLWNVNYMMFQNSNFTGKWIYAFINKMEYISENVTQIYYEIDVYQTWLAECKLLPSFVVREHVMSDNIGEHTIDEGLEHGEYIMSTYDKVNKMGATWTVVAFSDLTPMGVTETVGNVYGTLTTGLAYYAFLNTTMGMEWFKNVIQQYAEASRLDAIVMVFTVPKFVLPSITTSGSAVPEREIPGYEIIEYNKPYTDIDGYVPKNKKLFTHPYIFFYVSNNQGQSASYNYEDFYTSNGKIKFIQKGAVMPNPTIMLAPVNYKGKEDLSDEPNKWEYGLTLSGFPLCSWTGDAWTAWFSQNAGSVGVALAGSAVAIVGGVASGNPLAVAGGAIGVASQLAEINKATKQPDQARGQVNAGSLHLATDSLDFYVSQMCIKSKYAKIIDDYFTMYGYKVNTVKVPNVSGRKAWNYVQTIDVNIDGAIPSEDMKRLKRMYNEGVTFWKSSASFCNYNQDNSL